MSSKNPKKHGHRRKHCSNSSEDEKPKKHRKHCKHESSSSSSRDDERLLKINIDFTNDGECEKKDEKEICKNELLKMLLFSQYCKGPAGPNGCSGPTGPPGVLLISGIISPADGSGHNYTATHFVDGGQDKVFSIVYKWNSNCVIQEPLVVTVNPPLNGFTFLALF